MPKKPSPAKPYPDATLMAARVDRHVLYEQSVQSVDSEIDFVDETFRHTRKRRAARLREDFCGTAASACEWVKRRPRNTAVGLDLDQATLDWGAAHHLAKLKPAVRKRVKLLNRNVMEPGAGAGKMDIVLAMNFSWWIFKTRPQLLEYFRTVRASLVRDGLFFLDIYGGWESLKEQRDRRPIGGKVRGYTYIWDQEKCDPVTNETLCHIHFKFRDGSTLKKAFTYDWRVWTIPEVREALVDAGFTKSTVYWEGDDGKGGGDGVFTPAENGECEKAFIAYIVAER